MRAQTRLILLSTAPPFEEATETPIRSVTHRLGIERRAPDQAPSWDSLRDD